MSTPPSQGSWLPPEGSSRYTPPPADLRREWAQPGWGPPARTSGKATAALVLGILGLVFCPLICSVVALVLGYSARKEIDRSDGRLTGRGNAVAGIVLGWVGTILSLLAIAFLVVVAIVDPSFYDTLDEAPYDQDPIGVPSLLRVGAAVLGRTIA